MKKLIVAFVSVVLILSLSVSAFAVDSWNFYLDTLTSTHIGVGTVNISRVRHNAMDCTYITTTEEDDTGFVHFQFDGDFVSGQSYVVTLYLDRLIGSNANFKVYNSYDSGTLVFNRLLSTFSDTNSATWDKLTFSFVSDGTARLKFLIQPTSLSTSTGIFNLWISQVSISRYNPNEGVESRLDEQNSLVDEQNSLVDEQNSLIDEQNSLIDEQNSQLFDGTEQFTGAESYIDLENSVIEGYQQFVGDIIDYGSDIVNSERLHKGVLSVTYFFNEFWRTISALEELRWVRQLVYLSVICSIILLILSTGLMVSNKGNRKGGKGR